MDREDVIAMLKKKQGERSLRDLAAELQISAAYLSDVYLGRRNPGPAILKAFGLRMNRSTVIVYEHEPAKKTA